MPKKISRNKRSSAPLSSRTPARARRGGSAPGRPYSVKSLLARSTPGLARLTEQTITQGFWREWLRGRLPAQLSGHVSGVVERAGTVVVFAESAPWCARLRYAVYELEDAIRAARPGLEGIEVRVLPRG